MTKTRVHELAKEFGVESQVVLDYLAKMGEHVKNASSLLDLPTEMRFRKAWGEQLKSAQQSVGSTAYVHPVADTMELETEQAYFNRAWERREAVRHAAEEARAEGGRYDVKALVRQNKAYAEQLADPDTAVAHGSIALDDGDVIYVGRNSIWDEHQDVLVVNWRTQLGALYERATVKDPGNVARKRTFTTDGNTIVDFDDLIFSELASKVAELTEFQKNGVDDALLADLEAGRTGAMRDIVRTIQASQSDLIRHPADAMLVVQGGPGTGKSAVALHRASWLLFNEDGLQPDRMLVIGPSETFTSYIKGVLPGLGDANVPQTNLRGLGPQKSSRREELPETARLKGEERMAGLLERALHLRVRFAGADPELQIGQAYPRIAVPRADVEAQLEALRRMPTYSAGRQAMRNWLSERAERALSGDDQFTPRVQIDAQAVDAALERVWPQLTPQQFVRDLLGSKPRLQEAGGDAFTTADVNRLYRQASPSMASETWSDSDVALLDEAEARIRGTSDLYDHIVIDEAQDLSPMQLRSVRRRSANGRYTVVGDIAQSTGPWARNSWDEVMSGLAKDAPAVYEELDYGYRVPSEVYDIAAKLLPLIAPGVTPLQVVRSAPEPPVFIRDNGDHNVAEETVQAIKGHAVKGRFIGVVVAPDHKEVVAEELQSEGIDFADADKGILGNSVNLISATEAKGLEFDAVVVVEPAAIARVGEQGLRLLYIALTRATKYLTVVHAHAFEPLALEGVPLAPEPEPSFTEQLFMQSTRETPSRRATTKETSPATAGPASTPSPQGSNPIVAAVAQQLGAQIRTTLNREMWPAVLEQIARDLEVVDSATESTTDDPPNAE